MKRKTLDSEEDSNTSAEGRSRVAKACQRCRLKKCKCDGISPCCRCKADDRICAYDMPKKTDKMVYRRGYVQMLERQHTQLIRGIHAMYTHLLNGENCPGAKFETAIHNGQPSTHQILESLGVLQMTTQDQKEDPDSAWQTFDEHPLDDGIMYASATVSPTTQTMCSPLAPTFTQPALPLSPISLQPPEKNEPDPITKDQDVAGTPLLTTLPSAWDQGRLFDRGMACPIQHGPQFPMYQFDDTMGLGDGNRNPGKNGILDIDLTAVEGTFDSHLAVVPPA